MSASRMAGIPPPSFVIVTWYLNYLTIRHFIHTRDDSMPANRRHLRHPRSFSQILSLWSGFHHERRRIAFFRSALHICRRSPVFGDGSSWRSRPNRSKRASTLINIGVVVALHGGDVLAVVEHPAYVEPRARPSRGPREFEPARPAPSCSAPPPVAFQTPPHGPELMPACAAASACDLDRAS